MKASVRMEGLETQWEVHLPLLRQSVERFRSVYLLRESHTDLEQDMQRAYTLLEIKGSPIESTDMPSCVVQQARRAVEERVVHEMLGDRASPLWTLNFIWVVQQVCLQLRFQFSRPSSPNENLNELLDAVLESIPFAKQRDQVLQSSSEICQRIYKGLPRFAFKSNLDTWRTRIVIRTLTTARKKQLRRQLAEVTFTELLQPSDADTFASSGTLLDPVSADLTPDEETDLHELEQVLKELANLVLSERPATAPMLQLLLSGLRPREVAKCLGVEPSAVHRANHRWKVRMRELVSQYDPALVPVPMGAEKYQKLHKPQPPEHST
jgi:DNA-directed RNA polymerase specialized sigma24 family protein